MPDTDLQAELEEANWVTGVILNLIGSFSINLGTNLIQYSHFLTAKYKKATISSLKPSIIFCVAWLIFVAGNLLNFLSFSYATQTVLSSLGSVQFIANIIFIYILFRIYPTKIQLFGTISIIIGNICIVLVANKATFKFDSTQLIQLFQRIQYVSYLITIICLSILFQGLYFYLNKHQITKPPVVNYLISESSDQPQQPTKRTSSLLSNPLEMTSDTKIHHRFHALLMSKAQLLIPTCYALVSAMIGSQSVVLAKSSSFLITESIGSDSQFTQPVTYVFIASWGVAMMFWLYRMNNALRKYEGVFIIPVLQVLWMLFSILSGGILFREFDGYYWYNYIGFIAGTIIIFYGVYQLSPQKSKKKENKNSSKPQTLASTDNNTIDAEHNTFSSIPANSTLSSSNADSTTNINLCINTEPNDNNNINEELIDPNKVREKMNYLCDDLSINSMNTRNHSSNSLRNSGPDPVITEVENRRRERSLTPELPHTNSRSLRTIQKFFATTGTIIMKVTGADGRTHLAGPSLAFDNNIPLAPYSMTHRKLSLPSQSNQEISKPIEPIVTQSLPTKMPSDLKNAFEKIRLDNLKEERLKASSYHENVNSM